MAVIVTRETTQTDGTSPKGSPLTNAEVDTNFINLNDNKVEVSGAIIFQAKAGEALAKGDVVYVSGVSGNEPVVSKADANDASKMPAYGLAEDAASLNAAVNVVTFGTLYDLNTSSFAAGDTVYVSTTAGAITTTAPTGESSLLQNIGTVIRSHASAGSIKVGGAGRTNATPNLNDGNVFIGNGSNQAAARALTTADIASGTFADARIAQSNVTQHQAALSITESQISDLQAYLTAESDTLDSVTGRGATTTNAVTVGNLTSTGIDDNATSTAITIDSSQRIGIGTNSPSTLLELAANNNSGAENNTLRFTDISANTSADQALGKIEFKTNDSSGDGPLVRAYVGAFASDTTPSTYLSFATNVGGAGTVAEERLRITSSGNVGIGTGSPTVALQVSGQIKNNNGYLIDNGTNAGFLTVDGTNVNFGSSTAAKGLAFFTAATSQAMTIDSSGNVGIGRAPSTALNAFNYTVFEVAGKATNRSGALVLSTSNGTTYGQIYADDSVGWNFVNSQSGKSTVFYGSSGEHLRIDSSGNVNIGTPAAASGSHKLVIESASTTGTVNSHIALIGDGATNGEGPQILFSESGDGQAYAGGTIGFVRTGANSIGDLVFGTRGSSGDATTVTTEAMRITSSGYVGIGTTSPSGVHAPLTIKNNPNYFGSQINFQNAYTTDFYVGINGDTTGDILYYVGSAKNQAFYTSGTERMRIDASGNVGIGTSSPSSQLHINANADNYFTTGLRVNRYGTTGQHVSINYTNGAASIVATDTIVSLPSINFFTSTDGSSATQRMRIDSSGNVGIGAAPVATGYSGVSTTLYVENSSAAAVTLDSATTGRAYSLISDAAGNFNIWDEDASTVRMSIEYSGNVFVGTTSSGAGAGFNTRIAVDGGSSVDTAIFKWSGGATSAIPIRLWSSAASGDNVFAGFATETSYTGRGSIDYNRSAGQVRYNTGSDANLKNILGDSDGTKSVEILNSTRIREFAWKEDETQKPQIGVIAQELYETYKGAVSVGGEIEKTDAEGNATTEYRPWAVDKTAFTFHLVAGWQAHQKIIEELKSEIETLKSEVAALKGA